MWGIILVFIKMVLIVVVSFYIYEIFKDKYLKEKGKKEFDNWVFLIIGVVVFVVSIILIYFL